MLSEANAGAIFVTLMGVKNSMIMPAILMNGHNVAYNSEYSQIVSEHKGWLPASWEQPVPIKSDYEFNPLKYTWRLLRN